jgi:hypothetical protein
LQKIRRFWWLIGAVIVLLAGLVGEHGLRCWRAPLTREEAIARGQARLDTFAKTFNIREPLVLSDATLEADKNAWLVTYNGARCKVIIIVDRCQGDDVGSFNNCGG